MAKNATFSPSEGFVAEHDIREDDEQNVKLMQTIDLLLAAGYFRARIKGLSAFDKVVGGMTWCITTCNYDVDVDLLFQENSTIGQKIALTEKIVAVLPSMKCPHRIEPHQIQGLDFIHIFPVVQWLVKRAIETREEMGDYIRAYSVSQFDKHFKMPQDMTFEELKPKVLDTVDVVQRMYLPERKYKRHDRATLVDEEMQVQSTLLEYGKKYGIKAKVGKSNENVDKKAGLTIAHKAQEEAEEKQRLEAEEQKLSTLMSGLTVTDHLGHRIAANTVGTIVGMQSQQIQEVASQYAEKQAELDKLEKASPRISGAQRHKRSVTALQKQIQQNKSQLADIAKTHEELQADSDAIKEKLQVAEEYSSKLDQEIQNLTQMETGENQAVLQKLQHLVALNEKLKKQEQEFRTHCKQEMERLQTNIANLSSESGLDDTEDSERKQMIDHKLAKDQEKLNQMRIVLARKNREISSFQRKIDEVPTRTELSQYQQRFVELYNQIATKHKETKQFYTLHNTLDDTKLYLGKEISLLNSIHDTFAQAMSSPANKEQFLKQFEQIVEGVKQNRIKLEKKKQEEKMRRDQLNDDHLDLVEKQRVYYKTVKDFQEECRKNEILLAKLKRS